MQLYQPKEQKSGGKDRYSTNPQLLYKGQRGEGVPVRHCSILKDLPSAFYDKAGQPEEIKTGNEIYYTQPSQEREESTLSDSHAVCVLEGSQSTAKFRDATLG